MDKRYLSSSADSSVLRSSKQGIDVKKYSDLSLTLEPAEKIAKYNRSYSHHLYGPTVLPSG